MMVNRNGILGILGIVQIRIGNCRLWLRFMLINSHTISVDLSEYTEIYTSWD